MIWRWRRRRGVDAGALQPRRPGDPAAGRWVAFRERPGRDREYVFGEMRPTWMWTSSRADALRFDSEAAALAWVQLGRIDPGQDFVFGAEMIDAPAEPEAGV